jgi:hypothetical protein
MTLPVATACHPQSRHHDGQAARHPRRLLSFLSSLPVLPSTGLTDGLVLTASSLSMADSASPVRGSSDADDAQARHEGPAQCRNQDSVNQINLVCTESLCQVCLRDSLCPSGQSEKRTFHSRDLTPAAAGSPPEDKMKNCCVLCNTFLQRVACLWPLGDSDSECVGLWLELVSGEYIV